MIDPYQIWGRSDRKKEMADDYHDGQQWAMGSEILSSDSKTIEIDPYGSCVR
jgi:hypothetical protein